MNRVPDSEYHLLNHPAQDARSAWPGKDRNIPTAEKGQGNSLFPESDLSRFLSEYRGQRPNLLSRPPRPTCLQALAFKVSPKAFRNALASVLKNRKKTEFLLS
jgi:hypothetical protein